MEINQSTVAGWAAAAHGDKIKKNTGKKVEPKERVKIPLDIAPEIKAMEKLGADLKQKYEGNADKNVADALVGIKLALDALNRVE